MEANHSDAKYTKYTINNTSSTNKFDTQIQQVDIAQVIQLNKETTQTMCLVLQTDLNLNRHLLAMDTNDANVPLTPYLTKKHKNCSIKQLVRLVLWMNSRWLNDIIFQLGCFSSLLFFVAFFKLLIFFILRVFVSPTILKVLTHLVHIKKYNINFSSKYK